MRRTWPAVAALVVLCGMVAPPRDPRHDRPRPASYYEPCSSDEDCPDGLWCLAHAGGCQDVAERVCTLPCHTVSDCPTVASDGPGCSGCGDQTACGGLDDAGVPDVNLAVRDGGLGVCGFVCCR